MANHKTLRSFIRDGAAFGLQMLQGDGNDSIWDSQAPMLLASEVSGGNRAGRKPAPLPLHFLFPLPSLFGHGRFSDDHQRKTAGKKGGRTPSTCLAQTVSESFVTPSGSPSGKAVD